MDKLIYFLLNTRKRKQVTRTLYAHNININRKYKKPREVSQLPWFLRSFMVGARGFEPPTS